VQVTEQYFSKAKEEEQRKNGQSKKQNRIQRSDRPGAYVMIVFQPRRSPTIGHTTHDGDKR
jgi:hypothetical protein